MREIVFPSGEICLLDDEDYNSLSGKRIYIRRGWGKTPYAQMQFNGRTTGVHRVVMNAPDGLLVDHINHNTLDNRKENLRICTRAQNNWNRKRSSGTSKYKGVCYDKERNKWRFLIHLNDRPVKRGRFNTEDEAAIAYNKAAVELFGEFACLNVIGEPT